MTPIALLGKKGTQAVDYMVLCHGKADDSAKKESLCFVQVHEESSGAEVEKTSVLDTGWYFMDGPRTVISPDGVLSIRMAGLLWKMIEDPDGRFVYTDGGNAVAIRHVSNGESIPKVQIASDNYPEIYQVYYSTKNEIFIVTGYVKYIDANTTVRDTIESVKLLREDSKTAVPTQAAHEFEVRDASGTMYVSAAEASVYSEYNTSSRRHRPVSRSMNTQTACGMTIPECPSLPVRDWNRATSGMTNMPQATTYSLIRTASERPEDLWKP